jgi:glutaredoxin 3
MVDNSGRRTVPHIVLNDQSVGGFDVLWALEQSGKLDEMLG